MMLRLKELFTRKSSGILNVYCTAGYPKLDDTLEVMRALQDNGADIIELGIPYSDPLADGPVIQQSSMKALQNGMSIPVLFTQLARMRETIRIPVVLMGYLNPILRYGFEAFCRKCRECGVDGMIVPDIPPFEYEKQYQNIIKQYGLDFIFLVTPETSGERVLRFDELSSGFLYAVSSSAVTGSANDPAKVKTFLQSLHVMKLRNPVLAGFGIHDRESFLNACSAASGAIIGSAYIKALKGQDIQAETRSFLRSVLQDQPEF